MLLYIPPYVSLQEMGESAYVLPCSGVGTYIGIDVKWFSDISSDLMGGNAASSMKVNLFLVSTNTSRFFNPQKIFRPEIIPKHSEI